MPQDLHFFEPVANPQWITADRGWFRSLASLESLATSEKVHLARLALQLQWVCDVLDTLDSRAAIEALGLHVAAIERGYLIVSGNAVLAEYFRFRRGRLSTIETGVLYGYPSSAVLAFTGITGVSSPQPLPKTAAEYYLAGAYSLDICEAESELFRSQWNMLRQYAPEVCIIAEGEFASSHYAKKPSPSSLRLDASQA